MSKHTPVPMARYTLSISADSGYESTTEGRCTADQYSIAMAALYGNTPNSLSLIAAAPELLLQLQSMVTCFERWEDTNTALVMEAARDAIAKVTGEQA